MIPKFPQELISSHLSQSGILSLMEKGKQNLTCKERVDCDYRTQVRKLTYLQHPSVTHQHSREKEIKSRRKKKNSFRKITGILFVLDTKVFQHSIY
jgi:hypothetical protein